MTTQADPGMLVLISLCGGPKHGYALMQDIQAEMHVHVGPGTLYGAIGKLKERGMIRALDAADRRKPYEITDTGREEVQAYIKLLAPIVNLGQVRLA